MDACLKRVYLRCNEHSNWCIAQLTMYAPIIHGASYSTAITAPPCNCYRLVLNCRLPLLLLLLQYGGPAAQEAAAAAIENLSLDSDCEAALAAEGAIDGLLQVLKDGSTAAQVSRPREYGAIQMHFSDCCLFGVGL